MFLLNESLRLFRESYTKRIHVFNGRAKKAGWGRTVWVGGEWVIVIKRLVSGTPFPYKAVVPPFSM